jgi:hypothetical protein
MDAVREFAGPEATKPVIFPKAEKLITRMEKARHYRIATQSPARARAHHQIRNDAPNGGVVPA